MDIKFEKIDYAFQPIVNIYTGVTVAFEALIRNVENLGFRNIGAFFDYLNENEILFSSDIILREKVLKKFLNLPDFKKYKIFYNIDNRIIDSKDYKTGVTNKILKKYGYDASNFVFEISERYQFEDLDKVNKVLNNYRQQGFLVALDDFGVGYSTFKNFHVFDTDFLKIDRFFIDGISKDYKKRLIVKSLVDICKKTGKKVIAEGIENEKDFYVCKDLGVDYIQGYLVAKPTTNLNELKPFYEIIHQLNKEDKRHRKDDRTFINNNLINIQPMNISSDIMDLIKTIRENDQEDIVPIVNDFGIYKGVVLEKDLRKYIYSSYGIHILQNKTYGKTLKDFLRKDYPSIDVNMSVENILDYYSKYYDSYDYLVITEDDKYIGVLDAKSLLKVIKEKELLIAQNLNPLTKLAGNVLINQFIEESNNLDTVTYLLYFDFDNFKPFNDIYGFRRGDRAILLFADILRKNFNFEKQLLGHIGGDDFFVGVRDVPFEDVLNVFKKVISDFNTSVKDLYNQEDKERGYILAKDRFGETRKFNLLTVSGTLLKIPEHSSINREHFDDLLATLKKEAKNNKEVVASYYDLAKSGVTK